MTSKSVPAHDIFLNALEISDLDVRRAYIDAECRNDEALCNEVVSLLEHSGRLGDFLEAEQPIAEEMVATLTPTASPKLGTQIGPYTLRELLAEGGMGVVYVAEQTEPVKRKVALKIIQSGLATKEVVARFEAERQALAMMDHPNIARVFDGGATDSGQPYFVMELVQGLTITEYCDRKLLSTHARLQLFVTVCEAVHHAHQKGIIHRDLKPTNVLVAEIDG